jgi:hypothetical protein
LDLPSNSTLWSFAELAVSSLVKYSLETVLRLLIWRFDAIFYLSGWSCWRARFRYGWMPHNVSFGFLDIANAALGQIHFLDRF